MTLYAKYVNISLNYGLEGIRLNIDLGKKIRGLRSLKGLTIAELAKDADLSVGIISQIERNMVSPSIVSLWKIANCLGVSVGFFFEDENAGNVNPVVRANERKRIYTSNNKAVYELLSQDLVNKKIEFLHITIEPGDEAANKLVTHDGEECGIVIQGTLKVVTETGEYLLETGDSIYFNSMIPHKYVNCGAETSVSIWAMTPPNF